MEKFVIIKDILRKVSCFNLTGRMLEFKIKPIPTREEPVAWIRTAINQINEKGTEDLQSNNLVGFTFCSKDFQRGEGWLAFREAGKVTFYDIWNVISKIYQSNSSGLSTSTFCLGVTSSNGKGRRYNTFDECNKRRGIITINNKDNMCLPRALVVVIAYVSKDPEYRKVYKILEVYKPKKHVNCLRNLIFVSSKWVVVYRKISA